MFAVVLAVHNLRTRQQICLSLRPEDCRDPKARPLLHCRPRAAADSAMPTRTDVLPAGEKAPQGNQSSHALHVPGTEPFGTEPAAVWTATLNERLAELQPMQLPERALQLPAQLYPAMCSFLQPVCRTSLPPAVTFWPRVSGTTTTNNTLNPDRSHPSDRRLPCLLGSDLCLAPFGPQVRAARLRRKKVG